MREIIFDTETTGLSPKLERVIEIAALEMIDGELTGQFFHEYLNPQGRQVNPEALKIHGITDEFLLDKPSFAEISDKFLAFIDGALLVAHNAIFDFNFLNAELARINKPLLEADKIIDTLALAKKKYPMSANNLDALCKRFSIDNSQRTLHGALVDCDLLAQVYTELLGRKQRTLFAVLGEDLQNPNHEQAGNQSAAAKLTPNHKAREHALPSLLTAEEMDKHAEMLKNIGEKAIWNQFTKA